MCNMCFNYFRNGATAQNQEDCVKNNDFLGHDVDVLHILQSATLSMNFLITIVEKQRDIPFLIAFFILKQCAFTFYTPFIFQLQYCNS